MATKEWKKKIHFHIPAYFPTRWQSAARRFDALCGAWRRSGGRLSGDLGVQRAAGNRLHPDRLPGRAAQQRTQVHSDQHAEQMHHISFPQGLTADFSTSKYKNFSFRRPEGNGTPPVVKTFNFWSCFWIKPLMTTCLHECVKSGKGSTSLYQSSADEAKWDPACGWKYLSHTNTQECFWQTWWTL